MLYELEAYNTDCRYQTDVRYRAYTTSKKKADMFNQIPRIQFSDSGHGVVFQATEHTGRRKETISTLSSYVQKHLSLLTKKDKPKKKYKTILITVEGGVIQDISIPKGCNVKVKVRDYDCDETPETDDRVIIDERGDECYESIWEN